MSFATACAEAKFFGGNVEKRSEAPQGAGEKPKVESAQKPTTPATGTGPSQSQSGSKKPQVGPAAPQGPAPTTVGSTADTGKPPQPGVMPQADVAQPLPPAAQPDTAQPLPPAVVSQPDTAQPLPPTVVSQPDTAQPTQPSQPDTAQPSQPLPPTVVSQPDTAQPSQPDTTQPPVQVVTDVAQPITNIPDSSQPPVTPITNIPDSSQPPVTPITSIPDNNQPPPSDTFDLPVLPPIVPNTPDTPLVLQLDGTALNAASHPVRFDFDGNGLASMFSWIAGDVAWLALDRNGNGCVDSGAELFGSATAQGSGQARDGFVALRSFDDNHDGVIDARDKVFAELLLWRDTNADGACTADEITRVAAANIRALNLATSHVSPFAAGAGVRVLLEGTYITNDGATRRLVDVLLERRALAAQAGERSAP